MAKQSPPVEPAKLLDSRAVALLCGLSPRSIYRLSGSDKMPRPLKLGSSTRWDRKAIEDWIAGGCLPCRGDE